MSSNTPYHWAVPYPSLSRLPSTQKSDFVQAAHRESPVTCSILHPGVEVVRYKISNMNVEIISTPMTEIRMARVLVAPSLAAAAQSTFSSVQLTPHSHLPSPHLHLGADRTLRKYLISSKIRCLVIVSSIVGDLRLLPPPTQFAHPRQKLHNILPWPSAYILVLDGGYSSRW